MHILSLFKLLFYEWNKYPLQNWYPNDSTYVKRYACTRKVPNFTWPALSFEKTHPYTMAGMVIVVLCTNPDTCARGSRNSTNRTKIGSLKETTKRILRWLNHDHMLPPLHASSQFTVYSIILDMPVGCETVAFCPMHLLLENTCTRIAPWKSDSISQNQTTKACEEF